MPDKPFLLEPRKVAAACRKAMAEGRLGYQSGHRDCQYRYNDGSCCAIGAALPDDIAALADDAESIEDELGEYPSDTSVRELVAFDVFAVKRRRDLKLLARLQKAHDDICMDIGEEADFFAALEACEAA